MEMGRDQRLRKWWYDLLSFDMRSMGSVGAEKAIHYILQQVEGLGLDSQVQTFAYPGWELVSFTGLQVENPVEETIEAYPALGSAGGKVVQGRVVEMGETVIWDMYNWPRFGVFSNDGEIIAYITARLGGQALSQTLIQKDSTKPHLFVGEDTFWQWKEQIKQNEEILVSFELNVHHSPEKEGQNLRVQLPLAEADHGDKKVKVIIGAHYDTMYNTKGAYDNASGVAVLLGLIEWLQTELPPFSVECVFFGGEEFALAGSSAYVDSLSEKEREEVALMINLDGFGRGDILECWVSGERLEQNLWQMLMEEKELLFSRWKMVSPPPPGSDHTPFFNIGIPVVMFTVNDQEIIHTNRDLPEESMFRNMVKILQFLQILLKKGSAF